MDEKTSIDGIIFKNGDDDFELWEEFSLTKEEEDAILKILKNHETQGGCIRGTREEIRRKIEGNFNEN